MKIGIISAMDSEHRQLADRLSQKKESGEGRFRYVEGLLGRNDVVLTQCGIGKVNAAVGAAELIRRYRPDCIVSTGVAGGIDACLRVGDVVASDRLVYHDVYCGNDGTRYGQVQGMPLYYEASPQLLRHALELNDGAGLESRIHGGLICTGDRFVEDTAELAAIKRHFPRGWLSTWSPLPSPKRVSSTVCPFSASASSATHRGRTTTTSPSIATSGPRWPSGRSRRRGRSSKGLATPEIIIRPKK